MNKYKIVFYLEAALGVIGAFFTWVLTLIALTACIFVIWLWYYADKHKLNQ